MSHLTPTSAPKVYSLPSHMFQTYLKGVARESKEIFIRHFGGIYRVTCFPTAVAAQPIDWTISQTIIGPKGEDLPLRVGQGDEPSSVGFGLSHIKDSHGGFVPATTEIDTVLHNAPDCKGGLNAGNGKKECSYPINGRGMTVVATERVDPASGDGRPVGIITAFYR